MTRAMILSAGRGERIRSLYNQIPKALIPVAGKPLIIHHLQKLVRAGISEIVINLGYSGHKIRETLGDGQVWGVHIAYSQEPETCLGTGGGIVHALPLLGDAPFIVMSCDIWTDFDFASLPQPVDCLAHLVLVDNPPYHARGDFYLNDGMLAMETDRDSEKYTYANIGIYRPEFFQSCGQGIFPLAPLLYQAVARRQISGEHYQGRWYNMNTPEQLAELRRCISQSDDL